MVEGRKVRAARLVVVAVPDRMDPTEALRLARVRCRPDDLVQVVPHMCEGSPDPFVLAGG